MRAARLCLLFALTLALPARAQTASDLSNIFASVGFTSQDRAAIEHGRPVAKVLPWGTPSEIYVFGAVHVDGSPSAYLKLARNIARLAQTPGYLGIGELPADISALTIDPDDLKALKACREGNCDVQLPTESIDAFHAIDWSAPNAATRANDLTRHLVSGLIDAYTRGGNAALGEYRDSRHPARVADQFETMVSHTSMLPDVLPALRQYLLQYPAAELPGADSFFFWEKVNFGLKPTIRVNHEVIFSTEREGADISVVAVKQLYASHYFHTALDVSACVMDTGPNARRGFYLITLKGSQQDGLTGIKGSVLRNAVVGKTRAALERGLASIKSDIEHAP